MSTNLLNEIGAGLVSGEKMQKLFSIAKEEKFAIPAVNVVSTSSLNAVLESAQKVNSPIIVQFSNGGASFYGGKALKGGDVLGALSGARHINTVAKAYNIPVILHTDHAARKLLPWIDELIKFSETHYSKHQESLFSSHMLDLSEEPLV